jgi:hypothetical protein
MNAGVQMIHVPTGKKCTVVSHTTVVNESTDYKPHVQVQFEGQSYTSFVKAEELKEFLLG